MLQSKLFYKTKANAPKNIESINAKLLTQGSFVDQLSAGIFSYLPLGLKTLRNIEKIVREEMNNLGAQEVFLPALHPIKNYQTTKRENIDILYHLSEEKSVLGQSHEEVITPLVKEYLSSYKNLPLALYQIQTKFRKEPRAKSGLLRGREFMMKDLYSFHASQEDFEKFYNQAIEAYKKVYKRCGLQALITTASGGSFTKKHSHEFQVVTPAGEDKTIYCPKCFHAENLEISTLRENAKCPKCQKDNLKIDTTVECGNIFDLGDRFAKDFKLTFVDQDGSKKYPIMGCYGIGISRLLGTIVEVHHDDKGIVWPTSISPYKVHLLLLDENVAKEAKDLYNELSEKFEILFDDRNKVSAGIKFAEADLIGMPIRLVISKRSLEKNSVELKLRNQDESELIKLDEVLSKISSLI